MLCWIEKWYQDWTVCMSFFGPILSFDVPQSQHLRNPLTIDELGFGAFQKSMSKFRHVVLDLEIRHCPPKRSPFGQKPQKWLKGCEVEWKSTAHHKTSKKFEASTWPFLNFDAACQNSHPCQAQHKGVDVAKVLCVQQHSYDPRASCCWMPLARAVRSALCGRIWQRISCQML